MKVAILGSTGYTGQVLLRILLDHPGVRQIYPVSSSKMGMDVFQHDPGLSFHNEEKLREVGGRYIALDKLTAKPDVLFAALPHLKSAKIAAAFFEKAVIIDLSADFRIPDPERFFKAYGQPLPRPDLLSRAVYGLSEWKSNEIRKADLIANPGCYPTATLLPLLPIVQAGWMRGTVIVNALSGISGAGRQAQERLLYTTRTENMAAYAPGRKHRHWQEIDYHLQDISQQNDVELYFTPHLVPVHHGMEVSTSLALKAGISDEQIDELFLQHYAHCPFVCIRHDIPESSHVRGTNRCDFSWQREGDQLFLLSVIDNLYKGASGQAVQNMNLRFGLDEQAGLRFHGEI